MPTLSDRALTAPPARRDPTFTCATVCSGPVDARYRRAGRGDTVVVLAASDWPGGPALFAALAPGFRLIVPELEVHSAATADRPAFADWLTAFLDGLGLDTVALVADEQFGAAALGSALLDPERVREVAIVLDGTVPVTFKGSGSLNAGTTEERISTMLTPWSAGPPGTPCRTRLLVHWLGADHDEAAREIARSLTGRCAMD